MHTPKLFKGAKASRTTILFGTAVCIFYAGYFVYLEQKEEEADAYFAELQAKDHAAYLETVGETRGFDAFFDEYARLRDYDTPQEMVPPFLLGRWATFDEPKQVRENYVPENCRAGVIIEDGRVKTFGEDGSETYRVSYTIRDDDVMATAADGTAVAITPIAYTRHIHHLLVNLPGDNEPLYAYLCK